MAQQLPVIGVTVAAEASADADARFEFRLKASYAARLLEHGALPYLILSSLDAAQLRAAYELLDGVLMPGGADVDPARYGADPHPALGHVDDALDGVDLQLVRWAVADGKPLLGICRGSQVINVAFGGTLYQDLASELPAALPHSTPSPNRYRPVHDVRLTPDSRTADVLGATRLRVNSTHHQAIRDVAPGWRVVGQAPDGVVEAIEYEPDPARAGFALAVQWHPEELGDDPTRRLFEAFAAAARVWHGAERRAPAALA